MEKPRQRAFSDNCAVRQYTGDGVSVGRCWHYIRNGKCPTHGDVSAVQAHFLRTGELTDERTLKTQ